MKYESSVLKRLIDTYGVIGNPRYLSEIIKEFIVRGKELYPQLFTYQSDWLAHIDEFGLTPEYTVSYTGQSIYAPNTLERPVKSAILKGSTTDNILNFDQSFTIHSTAKDFSFLFPPKLDKKYVLEIELTDVTPVKGDSDYIAVRGVREDGSYYEITRLTQSFANGTYEIPITFNENYSKFRIAVAFKATIVNMKLKGELISVKMPVLKTSNSITYNLTEYEIIAGRFWNGNDEFGYSELVEVGEKSVSFKHTGSSNRGFIIKKIPLKNKSGDFTIELTHADKPNEWSGTLNVNINIFKNGSFVKQIGNNECMMFDSNNNRYYYTFTLTEEYEWFNVSLGIHDGKPVGIHKFDDIIIYNSKYECLMLNKTNILSTSEDVVLRGIGDVRDELDLLTGEVVERVGEIVLDGSENWKLIGTSNNNSDLTRFYTYDLSVIGKNDSLVICNKMTSKVDWNPTVENIYHSNSNYGIVVLKSGLSDVDSFKSWLSQNPLTVQYQLSTESVKTVDLTIHDKDHQKVERLTSFEGGTHFTTSSQDGSLLPTLTVDVVTDLEKTLMVCSLEGNTM